MVRYAVLFMFHQVDSLSINRLRKLHRENTDVAIFPFFGIRQYLPIPSRWRFNYVRQFLDMVNALGLKSAHFFRLSRLINERTESFRRRRELQRLADWLILNGMPIHCDFTPGGYSNLDLAILNWFATTGESQDFDYLIQHEYDMLTTKTIASLYDHYTQYDGAFAHFRRATPDWFWYNYPGARKTLLKWLKRRGLSPDIYACLIGGAMISRKALEALAHLDLPSCYCEMRLPTVLTSMGFSCGRLDFPMVNFRPFLTEKDVAERADAGIFHPVRWTDES